MSRTVQKWLRFITPAFLVLAGWWLLGRATGLWEFTFPTKPEEASKSLLALILGALYYVLPFRKISNKPYFDQVTENLRLGLLRAAGLPDDPLIFSWKNLRPIFWPLVDNDKSLDKKSSLALFNGYLWTTVADCRAISIIFVIFSLGIAAAGIDKGIVSAVIFGAIGLLTYPFSKKLTAMHKGIGDEQIEIIAFHYSEKLREQLNAVRARYLADGS
jgi:hypothetical protein